MQIYYKGGETVTSTVPLMYSQFCEYIAEMSKLGVPGSPSMYESEPEYSVMMRT